MSGVNSHRCSILIVEDEPIVAKDLQQTLREMNYDAFAIAPSADEAIKRAAERCPDLVLMDIRIKGSRDGIETARIFREQFGVSVIYLTAHADEATIQRAAETAPYGYLLKPIKSAELRSAIEIAAFRQEMEKCAHDRERRFRVALNSVSDAVVTVDLAGRVTYLNPAAESLIGMSADAAIGRSADELMQLTDQAPAAGNENPLHAALRLKKPVDPAQANLRNVATGDQHSINERRCPHRRFGTTARRGHGVSRHRREEADAATARARGSPLVARHDGGRHRARTQQSADGRGHQRGHPGEELAQLQADLRSSSVREMTSRSFARMFAALGDTQAAASRMGRIVGDLRGFARPVESDSESINLRRAIDWSVRATAHEIQHRAQLRTELKAAPEVRGDSARLEQVLVNLLVNAAHAIAPGRADFNEICIELRTDERGWAVIEISDTGEGIRPEVMAKIFEPFYTTKKAGTGTGLGLAICHGIVKSLGGEISVASELAKRTTFTIHLPPAPQPPRATTATGPAAHAVALRGRVLVIDDEKSLLRAIQRILEDEEHIVTATESAIDALAMIERGDRFDLIISDLMMPTMTGVDFYESLLARNAVLANSVIFMSGGAVTAKVDAFLKSVPNLKMDKPFKAAQLRDIVQQALAARAGTNSDRVSPPAEA